MPVLGHAPRSAALAVVLGAAGAVWSAPSGVGVAEATPAAPSGGCDGVTVVVDFGVLGGGTQTRCAPEPVGSGFEALTRAGFTYAGTTRFPGLLCRIDGKPDASQDACHNAPRPDFYWAYWTATEPGAPWVYSDRGAGNRDPAPGSVEGWAFSDGCKRQPGEATGCGEPAATSTTAAPGPTPAPGGESTPTVRSGSVSRPPVGPAAPQAPAPVQETAAAPVPSAPDVLGPDDVEVADEAALADRDDAPTGGPVADGSGSPTGVLAGAGIVGALGGLAVLLRRRQAHIRGVGE